MTILAKPGDSHTKLIEKYWGKCTPEIDQRIAKLNNLNGKRAISAGKKYIYSKEDVAAAENANKQRAEAAKKAKAEEARLKKEGLENISDICNKFNENPSDVPELSSAFLRPLEENKTTSHFGYRKCPIGKKEIVKTKSGKKKTVIKNPVKFHGGIDVGGMTGENIPAANDGKVVYANSFRGYGNLVVLAHQNADKRYFTVYAHCSELLVKEGDLVNKGQTVAKVGSTGLSTGSHLHFELRSANGEYIDPMLITQIEISDDRNIAKTFSEKPNRGIMENDKVLVDDVSFFYKNLKNSPSFKLLEKDLLIEQVYKSKKEEINEKIVDAMV